MSDLNAAMARLLNPQDYDGDLDAWHDALGTMIHDLARQYALTVDAAADFPEFEDYYDALVVRGVRYIDVYDDDDGLVSWVRDVLSIVHDGRRFNDPLNPHQDFINRYWFGPGDPPEEPTDEV